MQFDVWRNEWRRIKLGAPQKNCRTCAHAVYETLTEDAQDFAAILCGRNAVQISPAKTAELDLAALARKLQATGEVKLNKYLLRYQTGAYELTVFRDARAIIRGTDKVGTARSLYAKYIGI
jgi:adenylyltransferase/sulfurtransferase